MDRQILGESTEEISEEEGRIYNYSDNLVITTGLSQHTSYHYFETYRYTKIFQLRLA